LTQPLLNKNLIFWERTPVEVIRGYAFIIKKHVESNKVDPMEVLNDINQIAEAADKIKKIT